MPTLNWIVLFVALAFLGLLFGSLVTFIVRSFPTPENRPAPIGLIAANEQARIASLKRVAARQHQAQRDASARISRGW